MTVSKSGVLGKRDGRRGAAKPRETYRPFPPASAIWDAHVDDLSRFARAVSYIARRWRTQLDERMRRTGLTQARWFALRCLAESPGATQRALAEYVGVEPTTLVRLLDALERQGLVRRRPVEGDRRAYSLELGEAARPLVQEINAIVDEQKQIALEGVSPEELSTCLRVFERVCRNLEAHDPQPVPAAPEAHV